MRLPFFQPKGPEGPLRIRLPETPMVGFGVYFALRTAEPPSEESLRPVVDAWLDRHAAEPLRSVLKEFAARGFLSLQVGERRIRIRAVPVRSERIRDAVERAYAEKYPTPGSVKYVRGFRTPRRRETTMEFVPR